MSPTDLEEFSFGFDGRGKAEALQPDPSARPSSWDGMGFVWIHLRGPVDKLSARLEGASLDPFVFEALTAAETRPRCTIHGSGALLILRGVNLNEGASPEDMISVRLWIEPGRVVSCCVRRLSAIDDLRNMVESGRVPMSQGDLVAKLALRLADRAEPTVAALNEQIDDLEDAFSEQSISENRRELVEIRRVAVALRRYMIPQRDALTTLEIEDMPWQTAADNSRLREAAERMTRLGEELDSLRDRSQIVHDEIMDRRAERMNTQMLILTVVAAFFLPIGFVTSLLGINVGGIPLSGDPYGFWIVCGLIAAIIVGQWILFKLMKLF